VSVRDFYDALAADYHLVYKDRNAEGDRRGAALDPLIRTIHRVSLDAQAFGIDSKTGRS
jgi:hypothetical protein